jgi:glycosyltransferase involved in cell wall biosynthesis
MNKQPLVSFIMTCYNFEKYIGTALQSLLEQKGNYETEIIIFDDNSTDNSANRIAQINDKKIIFIANKTNQGAAACINKGFEMAKGKYICRFDGDDKWTPDFLETVIPIMEQNPDVGLLFGNYMPMDADGNTFTEQKVSRPKYLQTKDNDFKAVLESYYMNAPTIIFRKQALQTAFPIPQKFRNSLDWYLTLTILHTQTWKNYYLDKALAYYRIHENNQHRRGVQEKTEQKIMEIILQEFVENNDTLTQTEKKNIYGTNYRLLAFKYYSANMLADARIFFRKAVKYQKNYLLDMTFVRFFLLAYTGNKGYEKIKKLLFKNK